MNLKAQIIDELDKLYTALENSENTELSEIEELLYEINILEQALEN